MSLDDDEYRAASFHVIDFEAVTPRGYPPEPIEVAVLSLVVRDGSLVEVARWSSLMCPPPHAPVTTLDVEQTGITAAMVVGKPPAVEVLAKLDADVQLGPSSVLVAHHAPVEAGILYAYRRHSPRLARTHLLDTVRLGRAAYPDLHSHSLDMLIHHLRLRRPANRHRAMADVEVTAKVFAALLAHGARTGLWTRLRDLRDVAGYEAKATRPEQGTLFDEYDTSSST